MNFIKNLFNKKEPTQFNYEDFWRWFVANESKFHTAVKDRSSIEEKFFDPLSKNLSKIQEGFFFLTGMIEGDIADLIFTAEGNIKNFVFVEELIASAPKLSNWKFSSHKPSFDDKDFGISMNDYDFNHNNIFFYSNINGDYPDLIDLTIVHTDFNDENEKVIINGVYIFLDNYLGELNFATSIDDIDFISKEQAKEKLIPIEKLKDFLNWRQKEFIEKYEGVRNNTENDKFSIYESAEGSEFSLVAIINKDLLYWDKKASHPWVMVVEISYDGSNSSGMPSESISEHLNELEDEILLSLKDSDGYLNIGRQTSNNIRFIYFANYDFRKPSKVITALIQKHKNTNIDFDIYKDKYWQTFNKFA